MDALVLLPGEVPQLRSRPDVGLHQGLILSPGSLTLVDGLRRHHCRLPTDPDLGNCHWPLAAKLVSILIRHRPSGPWNEPVRLIYTLDGADQVIGKIDVSDTWEMRSDALAALAALAGLGYEVYRFDEAVQLLASHPDWADPQLEWFVDHGSAETGREWAWGIWLGGILAVLCGGAGMFFVIASPLGPWCEALLFVGFVTFALMTVWSKSRWRMRRSMHKAGWTGVSIAGRSTKSLAAGHARAVEPPRLDGPSGPSRLECQAEPSDDSGAAPG